MRAYFKFFLIFFLLFSVKGYSSEDVLLINSYHIGFHWTDGITEGVRKTLEKREDVNLFIEYMDSKRFNDSVYFNEFKNYLLEKYRNYHFRVVITSDNDALDFVLDNQLNTMWNVPLVFCGISNYQDYDLVSNKMWGVIETDDWYPILKTLSDIHGEQLENIYFVAENNVTGEIRKKEVMEAAKKLSDRVNIIIIENYTVSSLIKQVEKINGKSIIYYHGVGIDYFNNPVNPFHLASLIIRSSNVPVYSSYFGKGSVGGFLGSSNEQGIQSAEIVLKLIDGVDTSQIKRITIPPVKFIYDYQVAKKFDIDRKKFPENAIVVNKPGSLFLAYKKEVLTTIGFIIILLFVITLLIKNIFKRIKAEKHLIENEKRFREFAEMLPQTVFECDLTGNFTFVNDFGLESFGYTKNELNTGLNIFQVIDEEGFRKIKENIEKNINGIKYYTTLFNARRKDGSLFPFEVHSSLIYDTGKATGIRGIGINVTRQKQFEKELIAARKKAEESDKLKSAFLANMSHEIRTPLNSIVGFSYLLAERNLKEEEIKKMSFFIKNSSDHLLMLINDIIDISKIEAGQLNVVIREMNVNEIMDEVHQFLLKEKTITEKEQVQIIYKNPAKNKEMVIHSDALRLKQILLNLTGNSLKFTDKGYVEIGYAFENSHVTFHVKDTGIGINDELKGKIFQRFSKGEDGNKIYPGFGLGLSISKQLTELLNGKIWFEDNRNGGTVFYLTLPVHPE